MTLFGPRDDPEAKPYYDYLDRVGEISTEYLGIIGKDGVCLVLKDCSEYLSASNRDSWTPDQNSFRIALEQERIARNIEDRAASLCFLTIHSYFLNA